jgi:outer membrane protein OmpA-like peptidoglycan-associated protein
MGQLLETLAAACPPEQVKLLATLFNDTPEATARALGAVGPTILAALATRAEHGAMDEVMALAPAVLADGNPLDQIGPALTDTAVRATLMEHGDTLAQQLLGRQAAPIAAALAQGTGARADTIVNLLKVGGPLAIGALAKAAGGAPTAQGIASALAAERPAILGALPPGLAPLLAPLAAEATPLHGTVAEGAGAAAASASRWVPWLIAAVIGIVIVASLRNFQSEDADRKAAAPPSPIITEAPETAEPVTLPDGVVLNLRPGGVAHELARFLGGKEPTPREFRFEELRYGVDGATLDAEGRQTVRNLAAILAAWPATRVRIEGHTDADGDDSANLALSGRRASGVEALLEQDGVAPDRVTSEGLGETRPIATNDTAEGRAQNRRTVLIVTAR